MKTITIKAFSACEAVRFFNKVNPFMFHDELLSRFRERPEWYFMDMGTGEPAEAVVKVPDDCDFIYDHVNEEVRIDAPGASLSLEYVIIDGVRITAVKEVEFGCAVIGDITIRGI